MGIIREVGDSSILIDYHAWVDQDETSFGSARSQAIRDVKDALEAGGFSLPEPLYRVKFDGAVPVQTPAKKTTSTPTPKPKSEDLSTDVDMTITDKVTDERIARTGQTDLLDDNAPPE
jgi:hypothetical protein